MKKERNENELENFLNPQGDSETRIALVIAFTLIILGIYYGIGVPQEISG